MARQYGEVIYRSLVIALVLGVCLVGIAEIVAATGGSQHGEAAKRADLDVEELIVELGSEQFAVRERAEERLRDLGLAAFDALLAASRHDDVEIALRARYLVRSMPVRWSGENDPEVVKNILRKYAAATREERRDRMQQLAALADSAGIPALCRVARYEVDATLSKEAGLFAMNHSAPEALQERSELADQIRRAIGLSQRVAAEWLKAYAVTLVDAEASVASWEQLTTGEKETLARLPGRTERRIVRDLVRWQADLLRKLKRVDEFRAAARSSLEFVEGNKPRELLDFVDWALEREAWFVVDEVAERYPHEFYRHAALVYRLAEAQLKRGDSGLADKTARRGLAIEPQYAADHTLRGRQLQLRLMYEWAEREYRQAISVTEPTPRNSIHLDARVLLADMLFDIQRESGAAEVLAGAVELIEENPKLLTPTDWSAEFLKSTVEYYWAMHFKRQGDKENQVGHLERAFEIYPANPDILIMMYRVPTPASAWRQTVLTRIGESRDRLRAEIDRNERKMKTPQNEGERLEAIDDLAGTLNELAWLIGNTEGDFASAIQYSHRSLSLRPGNPAFLDTLARCYYAAGDLENAVKYQLQAVEGSPYNQQIRRQLSRFEHELAQRQDGN